MHAKGRLRHMFHGDYSAAIVLQFSSAEDAQSSLETFGAGWAQSDRNRDCVVWRGNSEALDAVKDRFASFDVQYPPCGWPKQCGKKRCKATSIDALTHSIDYGPEFTVDIPLGVPREQTSLF